MAVPLRYPIVSAIALLVTIWVLVIGFRSSTFHNFTSSTLHSLPSSSSGGPSVVQIYDDIARRERILDGKQKALNTLEADLLNRESALKNLEPSKKTRVPKSLITYAYYETPSARRNLEFFIQHGLHDAADFIFIFNGETDAPDLLPSNPKSPWYNPSVKNIEVVRRGNNCYDLGAHGEVLLREEAPMDDGSVSENGGVKRKSVQLWEKYSRFILMNASVRGPFMPYWSGDCWSERFWNKITEKVKLVGMAYNCHGGQGHVQSMVWAVDRAGLQALMQPPPVGIGHWCPIDMVDAIFGEVRSTPAIRNAGFDVDVLTTVYHSKDREDRDGDGQSDGAKAYYQDCQDEDFFHDNAYYGFNVHPYETIFMKSARHMGETLLGNLTEWHDGMGYRSYDHCKLEY